MRVLLIRHPTTHPAGTEPHISGIPLGLLYVAAAVRQAGHEVEVYDAVVGSGRVPRVEARADGTCQLGDTWDDVGAAVRRARPDVVGIGSQYTSQTHNAIRAAEVVKEVAGNIAVIVGGANATVMAVELLDRCSAIDHVVIGEGEVTTTELLSCLASDGDPGCVNGIAYRRDGRPVLTGPRPLIADLDALPLPAYDLLDMERYFTLNAAGRDGRDTYDYPGSERAVSMVTSRGCPFNCVFCSIHLSMGKKFRSHSVPHVLAHVRHLIDAYGVKHVHFEDDNLTFDVPRFSRLLDGVLASDDRITWDTPNGVRADYLDRSVLTKCRDSGCTYLRIGVESANAEVSRKIVRKALDLEKVVSVAELCADIGIDLEAFYIIGFPGETEAQMRETIDFAVSMERKHGLYPFDMFTAVPLVGTDLYRISREQGYLAPGSSAESLAVATQEVGAITTEDFSPATIAGLLGHYRKRHRRARVLYSLKFLMRHPRYLLVRIGDRSFLRKVAAALREGRFAAAVGEFLLFRYKHCVLRKIGRGPAPGGPRVESRAYGSA